MSCTTCYRLQRQCSHLPSLHCLDLPAARAARQACNHPWLVRGGAATFGKSAQASTAEINAAKKLPADRQRALVDAAEAHNDACPVCLDAPDDAVITLCGHIYCRWEGGGELGGCWGICMCAAWPLGICMCAAWPLGICMCAAWPLGICMCAAWSVFPQEGRARGAAVALLVAGLSMYCWW